MGYDATQSLDGNKPEGQPQRMVREALSPSVGFNHSNVEEEQQKVTKEASSCDDTVKVPFVSKSRGGSKLGFMPMAGSNETSRKTPGACAGISAEIQMSIDSSESRASQFVCCKSLSTSVDGLNRNDTHIDDTHNLAALSGEFASSNLSHAKQLNICVDTSTKPQAEDEQQDN